MGWHTGLLAASLAAIAVAMSACGAVGVPASAPTGSSPADPVVPDPSPSSGIAATGEVLAQTTVWQQGDGLPQLCLGGVGESYPPHCGGPVDLLNWDWDAVEQSETASGVTWGTYAVQGTWDGKAFTRTQEPIPLSLYDPIADFDPRLDPANPGSNDEATLERIELDIRASGDPVIYSSITNGYLVVAVDHDDGTRQERYDREFGPDTVIVQSALRPVP
ncbi:hypothetical protein ACX80Z_05155 [Arthrobacter sp. TMT4-20]